jgi:hypothetical protein
MVNLFKNYYTQKLWQKEKPEYKKKTPLLIFNGKK